MLALIPVRLAALVALLALAGSGAGAASPKRSCDYWLFSWKVRGGAYHFAVMPQAERAAFLANFPTVLSIKSLAELEIHLKALPKSLSVGWTEVPCLQITYPPDDIKHRIQRFAEENHITLLMIPEHAIDRMLTSAPKKNVRGDRDRSWMSDDYFDLIVWYYPDGSIYGFQLCYGKPRWERALTWSEAEGFAHTEVDTGEDQATRNRTPILVAGDSFPAAEVEAEFRRRSTALPVPLRRLVEKRISQFARRPLRRVLLRIGLAAAALAGVVIVGRLCDRVTVGAAA